MAEIHTQHANVPKARGVSLFVLLAIVIAIAGGGVLAAFSGDEITDPVQFREMGSSWAGGMEFAFALLIALVAALGVWLIFFLLIFRKRAGLWKNILILMIMIPAVVLVVVPIRIFVFTSAVDADERALFEWRQEAGARTRAIRARFNEETADFPVVRVLPRLERTSDASATLESLQRLRQRFEAYEREMEQELRSAREQLIQLDVFEGLKLEGYEYYDRLLAEESDVQRHFELTKQVIDLQIEALTYLRDRHGGWALDDGRIQFYQNADYRRFDEIMRPMFELDSDLDRVEGAMNARLDRPGDFWPGESSEAPQSSEPSSAGAQ